MADTLTQHNNISTLSSRRRRNGTQTSVGLVKYESCLVSHHPIKAVICIRLCMCALYLDKQNDLQKYMKDRERAEADMEFQTRAKKGQRGLKMKLW